MENAALPDHVVANNLLGFRNPSRWSTGDEVAEGDSSSSIVKIFEPKFIQIFSSYCDETKQSIDMSQHLMFICLKHLVPFCCWAREDFSRIQWIKTVVEDNIDLRPEVRNGLALILMYTMATAKVINNSEHDMFSIIQDSDVGFGIVNKTSLKIYNDPYSFLSFLKCCLTGLIDAGSIPENDRLNQPNKKLTKKSTGLAEEVQAFDELSSLICAGLGKKELAGARHLIHNINEVWLARYKKIRYKWFVTAMGVYEELKNPVPPAAVTQTLSPFSLSSVTVTSSMQPFPQQYASGGVTSFAVPVLSGAVQKSVMPSGCSGPSALLAQRQQYEQYEQQQPHQRPRQQTALLPTQESAAAVAGAAALSTANACTNDIHWRNQASLQRLTTPTTLVRERVITQSGSTVLAGDSAQDSYSSSGSGGEEGETHGNRSTVAIRNGPISSPHNNKRLRIDTQPNSLGMQPEQQAQHQSQQQQAGRGGGPSNTLIPVLRCEKTTNKEWTCQFSYVYNVSGLLESAGDAVFHLYDGLSLSPEEEKQRKIISSSSTGLSSLQTELPTRGNRVTSWPQSEHFYLRGLLEAWQQQPRGETSLVDFYRYNTGTAVIGSGFGSSNSLQSTGGQTFPMLVYEVVLQVGIVLRSSATTGVQQDCWRMLYVNELHAKALETATSTTGDGSFAALLCALFPQLRPVFATLSCGLASVVVKYCTSHSMTNNSHQLQLQQQQQQTVAPPPQNEAAKYQTLGTLSEPCLDILSWFDLDNLSFHDLIIETI